MLQTMTLSVGCLESLSKIILLTWGQILFLWGLFEVKVDLDHALRELNQMRRECAYFSLSQMPFYLVVLSILCLGSERTTFGGDFTKLALFTVLSKS